MTGNPAATAIAEALVAAAGRANGHQRLYLREHLGVAVSDIYVALRPHLTAAVDVGSSPSASLAAAPAGPNRLIPYLVAQTSPEPNQGIRNYAGTLRTDFAAHAAEGCSHILLILDDEPFETVLTAAQDAATLPGLEWEHLIRAVATGAPYGPGRDTVAAVADHLAALAAAERNSALLNAFADLAARQWNSPREAGLALPALGIYLADAAPTPKRLEQARQWRGKLEVWTRPDRDLHRELEKAGVDRAGVGAVLGARGLDGLDWNAFTLSDLPTDAPSTPSRLVLPAQMPRARSCRAAGSTAAVWIAADSELAVRYTGTRDPRALIRWGTHARIACTTDADQQLIVIPLPPETRAAREWDFGRLELAGGSYLDLAVYRNTGTWYPVEADLRVDTRAGAFLAADPPHIDAVAAGNITLGAAPADTPGSDDPETELIRAIAHFDDGASAPIPLIIDSGERLQVPVKPAGTDRTTDDEFDDEYSSGTGERARGESGGRAPSPDDSPDDQDATLQYRPTIGAGTQGTAATAAHALLDFTRVRALDGADLEQGSISFIRNGAFGRFSGRLNHQLEDQLLAGRFDGLELERSVLEQPDSLAFTAPPSEQTSARVAPDPGLERYQFGSLEPSLVENFLGARRTFFAALLADGGSVHAVLCGQTQAEARSYVEAYQELLLSIDPHGMYAPEYSRILLCDLVSDPAHGDCWLAPTNPITVAWALQLSSQAHQWAEATTPRRPGLSAKDIEALTPAFLLPLMHAHDNWWEADPSSPRLWRRYRRAESALVQASSPRTITRRLAKFLKVYPVYDTPRQRLALALHEPGDGGGAAAALRKFYEIDARPGVEALRPGLDVTVYTPGGVVPEELARLVAPDAAADIDKLVRSRIRLECRGTDEDPAFAHLSFAFNAPSQRKPRPAALGERCSTSWVSGLACAPGRNARVRANETAFTSGLYVQPGDAPLGPLLARTLELVGGQPDGKLSPGTTQALTATVNPADLDALYQASVWTTHADRLLGPEAFDGSKERIVDFDDRSGPWQVGPDSITVTSRIEPYHAALSHAFAAVPGAQLQHDALQDLINLGNAVSGRWNLDLLSMSVNHVRERLGLLAAIAAVRDLDQLHSGHRASNDDLGGVLLPLADLIDLLSASGVDRPTTRKCDDLLYLRIGRTNGGVTLNARLIEVKYVSSGQPDLSIARNELHTTRSWLSEVFDPARVDYPFRSRDLAEYVRVGCARNAGFGLASLSKEHSEDAAAAIGAGRYTLGFAFRADGDLLHGDVISLELDNDSAAHRQLLSDPDKPLGYIRLGAPALKALARGEALTRPAGWPSITFPEAPAPSHESPRPDVHETDPGPELPAVPELGSSPTGPDTESQLAAEVAAKAAELDSAAAKYALNLAPFDSAQAQVGPSVIRYRTRLLGRQTIAAVRAKALDLGREIGVAEGVLIDQEPYALTVDVPRSERVVVKLADHLMQVDAPHAPGALPFLLGMAPSGEVKVADLARLPHLLVAGATGSGKSVLLRGLLTCLVRARSPQQLQILLIDPKQVDFMLFEDMPHLVGGGIVTDPGEAVDRLASTLESETAWRRGILKQGGVTSALEFYEAGGKAEELPQMVVLVDEFADLGASLDRRGRQSFMTLIQRYGQLTRAFGIYLVLATQRPSVQVITGDIKANLTARVALKMQSHVDSTTILGRGGAESLRDRGDLLFDHAGTTERLQAFFTTPSDVRQATARWDGHASIDGGSGQ